MPSGKVVNCWKRKVYAVYRVLPDLLFWEKCYTGETLFLRSTYNLWKTSLVECQELRTKLENAVNSEKCYLINCDAYVLFWGSAICYPSKNHD